MRFSSYILILLLELVISDRDVTFSKKNPMLCGLVGIFNRDSKGDYSNSTNYWTYIKGNN